MFFARTGTEEDLKDFIRSRIREEGPVSFAQFMEWCLYHPVYGYYTSGEARIGREGDYYTSPCVNSLFGGMITRQLRQMDTILGGDTFTVLEMGSGRGFLCEDILAWAKNNAPEFYDRLIYCIVEPAPHFFREQQEKLSWEADKKKVFLLSPETIAGGEFSLEGCILSNELVDAFPVHRVICDGGELKEIHVGEEGGRFVEIWEKPSDSRISTYFADMGIALSEGQKAEVNLQALEWLESMERCLLRGFILTIDYGYRAEELYDPCRREGTLMCYFHHQISDSPYERIGGQDITSHVNFTSLIRKGEDMGVCFTGLVPQYRFLIALGLLEEIATAQKELSEVEALKLRLSLKHLIEPERGMGEIFKVLIQHKGIEKHELTGLRELRTLYVGH